MTITEKCEQYWNEINIRDEEIHAVLEFIHREARILEPQLKHSKELVKELYRNNYASNSEEDFEKDFAKLWKSEVEDKK